MKRVSRSCFGTASGTLVVMLGTIALTGYLYVVIPKGLLSRNRTPD